jgi:hypothetical protein
MLRTTDHDDAVPVAMERAREDGADLARTARDHDPQGVSPNGSRIQTAMRWKYYIPSHWTSPDDRTSWEDVWLLPEDGRDEGQSCWFTLHALPSAAAGLEREYPDDPEDPLGGSGDSPRFREMNLELLGDRDYLVTPTLDMIARIEDFNLEELLKWTALFIQIQFGDPEPELVRGDRAEFAGSNRMAREIERIEEAIAADVPGDQIMGYRAGDASVEPKRREEDA